MTRWSYSRPTRLSHEKARSCHVRWRSGLQIAASDGLADGAQDARDLAAQEDQGDDRDDRDEGEDQRVLRETLAFLVAPEGREELLDERHVWTVPPVLVPPSRPAGRSKLYVRGTTAAYDLMVMGLP